MIESHSGIDRLLTLFTPRGHPPPPRPCGLCRGLRLLFTSMVGVYAFDGPASPFLVAAALAAMPGRGTSSGGADRPSHSAAVADSRCRRAAVLHRAARQNPLPFPSGVRFFYLEIIWMLRWQPAAATLVREWRRRCRWRAAGGPRGGPSGAARGVAGPPEGGDPRGRTAKMRPVGWGSG